VNARFIETPSSGPPSQRIGKPVSQGGHLHNPYAGANRIRFLGSSGFTELSAFRLPLRAERSIPLYAEFWDVVATSGMACYGVLHGSWGVGVVRRGPRWMAARSNRPRRGRRTLRERSRPSRSAPDPSGRPSNHLPVTRLKSGLYGLGVDLRKDSIESPSGAESGLPHRLQAFSFLKQAKPSRQRVQRQ